MVHFSPESYIYYYIFYESEIFSIKYLPAPLSK